MKPGGWLRGTFYQTFYRLPPDIRRRLVRLGTAKYIVGAVTLVWDSDAPPPGRLLLLLQPPRKGWTLPAGLLKRREPPVVGAARELAEETGIRLDPGALRAAVPNAVVHAKGWVDTVFVAEVPAGQTELVVDGGEVFEAAWHPLDGLPRLSPATARLLAYYGIGPLADELSGPPGSATPADSQAVVRAPVVGTAEAAARGDDADSPAA